jgi:hypothetical protein
VVAFNRKDANAMAMVEGKISISGTEAKVLIDLGSTHSFIVSHFACALSFGDKAVPCNVVVSTHLGRRVGSKVCYEDCEVRFGDVVLATDLMCLPIDNYDIILEIDWLSRHYAWVDCKRKIVQFCRSGEDILMFKGEKLEEENCLISGMKARKLLYKSCTSYLAYLLNKPSEPGEIEKVPVVREYLDVFPVELTEVPPDREVELAIDLMPMAEPVSWTPYRMALAELKELKEQLQELLT